MSTMTSVAATTSSLPRHTQSLTGGPATQAGSRWRVVIVNPLTSVREMIRMILDGYSDLIEVAGEASDAEEAIELTKTTSVDLVLMDAHLPNGVDATRQIKRMVPQVVIMGMSTEYSAYLHNTLIAAGTVGFVRMEDAPDLLFRSIVFAMCTYGPMHRHVHPVQTPRHEPSFA